MCGAIICLGNQKPLNNIIGEEHPWHTLLKKDQFIQSYVDQLHIWISL